MGNRALLATVVLVGIVALVFGIMATLNPKWVTFDLDNGEYSWGLFKCADCAYRADTWATWACWADSEYVAKEDTGNIMDSAGTIFAA
jgi:hypothetical protein